MDKVVSSWSGYIGLFDFLGAAILCSVSFEAPQYRILAHINKVQIIIRREIQVTLLISI